MSTFNLTLALEELIADIVARVPEFGHIDTSRILVCVSSTRGGGIHGAYAKVHPLRFEGGQSTIRVRRGGAMRTLALPEVRFCGRDILYIIYYLIPRFLDLPFREKLITVFHELYHVSPLFNGDIRRFPGKNYAHGGSRKRYDAVMAEMVDAYLRQREIPGPADFLEGDLETLRASHGVIVGRRFPAPKIRALR